MAAVVREAPTPREKLLDGASTVPPFPRILDRLLATLAKEDVLMAEICELVEKDTTLAGNLLRTVNSSLYGMSGTVNSVRHALAILGLERVRNVTLTMSLVRLWRRDPSVPGWSSARFNLHCAATAIMSDVLVQRMPVEYPEGAFTAGLFHDFGKVLVASLLPLEFGAVRTMVEAEGEDQESSERALLGITHSELSAAVLENWKLPAEIVRAVREHHSPRREPEAGRPLAQAVELADRCVNRIGISALAFHPESGKDPAEALATAGLGDAAHALLSEFHTEFEVAKAYF